MKKSDFDLVLECKNGNSKAFEELFNRYKNCVAKNYFKKKYFFDNINMNYDDYCQESFLALIEAVKAIDIEKWKEHNIQSFNTIYFYYLKNIENSAQKYYEKYGIIAHESQYTGTDDNDDLDSTSYGNEWIEHNQGDVIEDVRLKQEFDALEKYKASETNSDKKFILNCLLEGENCFSIKKKYYTNKSYYDIKRLIDNIKECIRNIAIEDFGWC